MFCFVFSIAGNAVLQKSDLKPALKALKDKLMTKNVVCSPIGSCICFALAYDTEWRFGFSQVLVSSTYLSWIITWQAEEIAEKLCESVAASLEGKKLGSFTRVSSTVQVCCFFLDVHVWHIWLELSDICFLIENNHCRQQWKMPFFAY